MSMNPNSPTFAIESTNVWTDFRIPTLAMESRVVTSASVITMSSSFTPGVPYVLFSDGGTVYFTLNGQSPGFTPGVTNTPIPVANGEKFPFMVSETGLAMKLQCTGSVYTNVTLMRAVVSQSILSAVATTEGITV